jgi:hypothetical protein
MSAGMYMTSGRVTLPSRDSLQKAIPDIEVGLRWQTSLCCWEEYAASRLSESFYPDQIQYYEQTFSDVLDVARARADQKIQDYVKLKDEERLVIGVAGEYRTLMTFASYVIGHLAGVGMELSEALEAKLGGHWFASFFVQLEFALGEPWDRYGQWKDWSEFDSIGQIGRLVMLNGGVDFRRSGDQLFLGVDESRGASRVPTSARCGAGASVPSAKSAFEQSSDCANLISVTATPGSSQPTLVRAAVLKGQPGVGAAR